MWLAFFIFSLRNTDLKMPNVIQHLYKFSSLHGGLLYAWFPSMHTRVDIVLCGRQGEEALMLVVGAIHEMLYHWKRWQIIMMQRVNWHI